jgi:RNA polymerase sigma-70 factor (ECF subfamily)
LFEEYYDAVARYCLRRLSHADAGDAASRVFVVAWRKVDEMPDGDGILPWLYGIARYEVNTIRRAARRWDALHMRMGGLAQTYPENTESVVVRRSEHEDILAALGSLSKTDREVILLRSYEDLPISQIAVVLGCSSGAASKRHTRALKRLRKAAGLPREGVSVNELRVASDGGEI